MSSQEEDASRLKMSEPMKLLPSSFDTHHSVLSQISSVTHVRVAVNDLVAFEYVCKKTKGWKWGLGTVAAIPSPRLVQLMLWAGSGGELPPEALPVSEADRAAAVKRLKELQRMRQEAEEEMEDLNRTLTVKHAHYREGLAVCQAEAARAQEAAAVAREEVKNMEETDWREIRSYVKPPDIVKLVTEAMMLTLGEKILEWKYILKVVRQRSFLKRLEEFDSQSISLATRRRLRKEYLSNPRFTHRDSMEGSRALGIVQRWVVAQLANSEATVDVNLYNQAQAQEKKHIEKMEDALRERRKEAEKYKDEEIRLKRQLGDSPIHINYRKHDSDTAKGSSAPSPKAISAKNAWSPRGTKSNNGAYSGTPRGRPGAPPLHENIHSTANTWVFTDESEIVLHSSILVNYDTPASTVVTLTPEQVEMLKKALEDRAALFAEQQKADDKIKNLEDDLESVRGVLADALQDLADAKAALAAQDAELAAKDRHIEEAKEAAAAAARTADTNKAGLSPLAEEWKAPAHERKDPHQMKAPLGNGKEAQNKHHGKKGKKQGGWAEVELEKEMMVDAIAHNGSMPALFHAGDDRELAKIIDRLEKEIRILRSESEAANLVLDVVHDTVNASPELKEYFETLQDVSGSGGLVTGHLVDASDPSVGGLLTASIPSPKSANRNRNRNSTLPRNVDDSGGVMTAEELQEMQEHRDTLKADIGSSRERVREIDELLRHKTQEKNRSTTSAATVSSLQAPSLLKEHLNTPRETVDGATKAANAAEKELLLARAGLRTVKPFAWADLRRYSGSPSPVLVSLIETAVALLHDSTCVSFDDAIVQALSLPKRLVAVKSTNMTADDTQRALRFLKACPTVASVAKEHKTAASLYRWVSGLTKAAEAQRRLKAAQQALVTKISKDPGAEWQSKARTRSAEPAFQAANKFDAVAEEALRTEREDQLEYLEMAEEELAAIGSLIAEAEELALSLPHHAQDSADGTKTIVPALVVPTSWVVCLLPGEEAAQIEPYTHHPRGQKVEFSSASSRMISTATKQLVPPAMVYTDAPQDCSASELTLSKVRREYPGNHNPSGSSDHGTDVHQYTGNHQRSPRATAAVSTDVSFATLAPGTEVTTARKRAEDAEEKTRLLEARLSAALQHNPKEAEVQLLRDELDAKRAELRRVTEERNRLLQERCDRRSWYAAIPRRSMADDARSSKTSEAGSGRYVRQPSTPRDTVDRSVVEELEDELRAAHERISELLIGASERRHNSPSLAAVSTAAGAVKSSRVAVVHGDNSLASVSPSLPREDISTAPHSASGTPRQRSLRGTVVSPCRPISSPVITQEMYDDLQARLRAVLVELEAQRRGTQQLEEQLNDALHRRSEAEHMVLAQKHELEEVWEKLQTAEARAEEQELLTHQRLLLTHTQCFPSQSQLSPLNASTPLPSVSTMATSAHSQAQQSPLTFMGAPFSHAHHTLSVQDVFGIGSAASAADAEVRSPANEDVIAIAMKANAANGNVFQLSADMYLHSTATSGPSSFGGGGGGATSAAVANAGEPYTASPYSGVPSALPSRPVEQLSTIELRHEVHRLREEVERYQSGELRMLMELQTLREKQKAERKRHRDSRSARLQMLARMQGNIDDVIKKSTKELEAIPALLERSRARAQALMARHRMGE